MRQYREDGSDHAVVLIALVAAALALGPVSAGSVAVSELSKHTHIHGIAVPAGSPSRVYIATHHGFFGVEPDGMATRLSEADDDFMGFTPHPTDPSLLYASGHPVGGGAMGIIMSVDGGKTWRRIADGVDGPVDFHQMDVSQADPQVIYVPTYVPSAVVVSNPTYPVLTFGAGVVLGAALSYGAGWWGGDGGAGAAATGRPGASP